MNLSEFRRRFGAEPRNAAPDLLAARTADPAFEAAAREIDAFEDRLEQAALLPVDEGALLEEVLRTPWRSRQPTWYALAASLVAAVGVAAILWSANRLPDTLPEYLVAHYAHDGETVLARVGQNGPGDIERVLSRFDVSAGPALIERIGYIKICPSLHGNGAHMVVLTDEGWVTVFYLPGVEVQEGGMVAVADEQARLVAMVGGAAAIIGPDPAAEERLAALLHESLLPVANDA